MIKFYLIPEEFADGMIRPRNVHLILPANGVNSSESKEHRFYIVRLERAVLRDFPDVEALCGGIEITRDNISRLVNAGIVGISDLSTDTDIQRAIMTFLRDDTRTFDEVFVARRTN